MTFRLGLIQVVGFKHAWAILSGKYDNETDPGEITHLQALSTALSATIGTGNIAGVATAIAAGGPGAVFWMWVTA
ncbi:MAG: sodium:alanine symporter family protein, partial [Deltaproteobacteria bacterium]|nr:sodium:alanine symporter family protein [Deltaproteobacteria bacterium]